jgi:hypothetical protein
LAAGTAPSHWRHRPARSPNGGFALTTKLENDVYKLKGIGPKHTEMLESIGVDSIKELRHRDPVHLLEMIEKRHGPIIGMSIKEVTDWIEQAKAWKE